MVFLGETANRLYLQAELRPRNRPQTSICKQRTAQFFQMQMGHFAKSVDLPVHASQGFGDLPVHTFANPRHAHFLPLPRAQSGDLQAHASVDLKYPK